MPFFIMKLTQKQEEIVERLGYSSPESFLNYYPYRYDHLETKPFDKWQEKNKVVFSAELVSDFKTFRFGKNQSVTNFSVIHEGNIIKCSLFNRPFLKQAHYTDGLVVVGTVGKSGTISVQTVTNKPLETVVGINPIYGLKAGIKNFEIVRLITKILKETEINNILPSVYQQRYRLLDRHTAVKEVHQPTSPQSLKDALRTLKYEEFLKYHLNYALNHEAMRQGHANELRDISEFILPFTLNNDQIAAIEDIRNEIASPSNMFRMLQGDVGSGKTIVAFLSALSLKRGQAVLMVPTETLAIQHFNNFKKLFPNELVYLFTQDSEDKDQALEDIADGKARFVIGTHALFQKSVHYKDLRLAIVDEQHRFGVEQRQSLYDKGNNTDVLMLSATPIPRTLASSLFFDMKVSTLKSHPKNRTGSQTFVIEENSIRSIVNDMKAYLKTKGQIYIVCPAIDVAHRYGIKTVESIVENIAPVFKDQTMAAIHGGMSSNDKSLIMSEFESGKIDILVCTTVIEVGVDVHNANMMIIYNAELFGLATLHQLRGRVGRGVVQGTTYLLSGAMEDEITQERLNAVLEYDSGFDLAMIDLRLRGFGDLLGSRQSGMPQFILGDIINDEAILKTAKVDAQEIMADRNNPDYQSIIEHANVKT